MKKTFTILAALLAAVFCASAQTAPEGYEWADSLVFIPLSSVDSTLAGKSIFNVLPDNVKIEQSGAVRTAVEGMARNGGNQTMSGYRIRIFFDNSRTARGDSEAALYRFKVAHPGTPAYRTFTSPYFKVTVGDYRNKSEALEALYEIKGSFPSAFIVKEKFQYPQLENTASFKVDTLRYLRRKQ